MNTEHLSFVELHFQVALADPRTPATGQAVVPLAPGREREIAALVREGLSNKQIAETLNMSVRTVEGHIDRACTKLGLAGRTELAALVG